MRLAAFSCGSPAIGEQLRQFAGLHRIDSGEDIGEVFDWVDVVGFARSHEGQVNCGCFAAGIRAYKETVLPHQDEVFDGTLGRIIVDFEVRILEEPCQSDPVVEGVLDRRHEHMCRIEPCFEGKNFFPELLDQGLGADASSGQPFLRRLSSDVSLYCVELLVYIQNDVGVLGIDRQAVVIFPSRVSVAANLRSRTIFEKRIETVGCIRLDVYIDIFKPLPISFKTLVGREIENCEIELLSDVDGHLAFSHSSFHLAILDFNYGIVGVDHVGRAYFARHQLIQMFDSQSRCNAAVALRRAWNDCVFSFKSFFLPIVRQAITEPASDDIRAQRRCKLTVSFIGLLGCDDVGLAPLTRPHFLLVLKKPDGVQKLVELVADFVADEHSCNQAVGTDCILRRDFMRDWFSREFVFENVLARYAVRLCRASGSRRSLVRRAYYRSLWIVPFGCRTKVFAIALFELRDENVELLLKILQLMSEVFIAGEGFGQLFTQFATALIGFSKMSLKRGQCFAQLDILLPQTFVLGVT